MRILLVEDDIALAEVVAQHLKKEHFQVDIVYNGEDAYSNGTGEIYDLIILDIMLPKMDGLSVLKRLREEKVTTPVLILTAKGEVSDRVEGLNSGADDYLPKPFASEELIARSKALARRKDYQLINDKIFFSDLALNTSNFTLSCGGRDVVLTAKEFDLFHFLILRRNMITTKDQIIEKIWGYEADADDNNVEVYISLLRKKINFLESSAGIKNLRYIGYKLEVNHNAGI